MSLQLLKRNYTMTGRDAPKILKLPQGEERWAPRRLPVDVGDVMMNIRMDDGKNRYIGEHISKYAQGVNPYGEFGYPYKVNKNNIRPPIVDPKFYEPISRMPVKFDAVTVGPIVKDLYTKRIDIEKVAPKTIIDKVSASTNSKPSRCGQTTNVLDKINLHLKKPHTSIPYHPSMPIHLNTGVPHIELDAKIFARPNMSIHAPFNTSDQSRDVNNMRTPMHIAVRPGYKDPYTFIQSEYEKVSTGINENDEIISVGTGFNSKYTKDGDNNNNIQLDSRLQTASFTNISMPVDSFNELNRQGYDLTAKIQTSAWYNPSYQITDLRNCDINDSYIANKIQPSVQSKPTNLLEFTERQMSDRVSPMISENNLQTNVQTMPTTNLIDYVNRQIIERVSPMISDKNLHTTIQTLPSTNLFDSADRPIAERVSPMISENNIQTSAQATHKYIMEDVRLNDAPITLADKIQLGEFASKADIPTVQNHQTYDRARELVPKEYLFVENHKRFDDHQHQTDRPIPGLRKKLNVQAPRVDRTGVQPDERQIPVGTDRFIY